jgi:hypothetical protein
MGLFYPFLTALKISDLTEISQVLQRSLSLREILQQYYLPKARVLEQNLLLLPPEVHDYFA